MSSMGRKEGIVEGDEEPYVAGAFVDCWGVNCWFVLEAVEVCGRVNSSKRSARRGWCMCRWVAEESLLWGLLVDMVVRGCLGKLPF